MTTDVYQTVTDAIVEQLENGTGKFVQPWHGSGSFPMRSNGQAYKGINTIILWAAGMKHNYTSNRWVTYRQAKIEGGCVRKGEHGTCVIFYKPFGETVATDGTKNKVGVMLRSYSVFNVNQCDDLKDKPQPEALSDAERIAAVEKFVLNTRANIVTSGDCAVYSFLLDVINMPAFSAFKSIEGYYGTLLHELAHWTGHSSRLDRIDKQKFHENYDTEELVAELSSAFLCAHLKIENTPREDHASYLSGYLKRMKDDKKAIFRAAAAANKAAMFLQDLQPAAMRAAA